MINTTHDAGLRSWVGSANRADTDFPIQNLPLGVFRRSGSGEAFRGGVAIGDQILDLGAEALRAAGSGGLVGQALAACGGEPTLNSFMAMGRDAWSALRVFLSGVLRSGSPHAERLRSALVPQKQAEYALPAKIGDYTDFYTSIHHATSVGRLFRPDNPLLPNYKWVPIGYHGRASSIRVSGQKFPRPVGQILTQGVSTVPQLAPTAAFVIPRQRFSPVDGRDRCAARSLVGNGTHARHWAGAAAAVTFDVSGFLLDRGTTRGPSHRQRVQSRDRRSAR